MNLIRCSPVVVSLMFLTNVPLLFEGGGRSIITIAKERKYWPVGAPRKALSLCLKFQGFLKRILHAFTPFFNFSAPNKYTKKFKIRSKSTRKCSHGWIKIFQRSSYVKKMWRMENRWKPYFLENSIQLPRINIFR